MTTPVDDWLRYTHLEKLYGYLPGMAAALPDIFGLSEQDYRARCDAHRAAAGEVAAELVRDPRIAALVDAVPVAAGQRILCVGDSITDDLRSWAEMLRCLFELRRPQERITVINGGLSAHTTAMILRRWPATLTAAQPDLIICALGGNDVTRIGADSRKTVVSRGETLANLREMRRIAADRAATARWVWMTPAPVLEDRVRRHPAFRFGGSDWRNADILALAQDIRGLPDPTVDLTSVFGVPADADLQGADGVHPTLAGQRAITIALLEALRRAAIGGPAPDAERGSA